MRCAILRLTSRGVSPAEPRRTRDSVETQAMTSRRAGQGTNRRKVAPKAATWEAVSKKEFLGDSTSCTSATEGEEEEEAGRRREEMEKSQASANPEDPRGTHTSAGPRLPRCQQWERHEAKRDANVQV